MTPAGRLNSSQGSRCAIVMPAMPGFYHRPESIDDLVDFVVARILDQLGLDNTLVARWGQP